MPTLTLRFNEATKDQLDVLARSGDRASATLSAARSTGY